MLHEALATQAKKDYEPGRNRLNANVMPTRPKGQTNLSLAEPGRNLRSP